MNAVKPNNSSKQINKTHTITLERVDFIRDRDSLFGWLNSESVRKWWGNPTSRLQNIEHASSDMHALICKSGSPVGYICWQRVIREELDRVGLFNVPENLIDIDLFIGDPYFRGQGIGQKVLELLKTRLSNNLNDRFLGLVTSIKNKPAICAFEKSGFKKKYQFESKSFGICWFMECKI